MTKKKEIIQNKINEIMIIKFTGCFGKFAIMLALPFIVPLSLKHAVIYSVELSDNAVTDEQKTTETLPASQKIKTTSL
jgi:hypothetical protein